MLIREIIQCIEDLAPPVLQEAYDNVGLLIGNEQKKATAAIVCLDVTEKVIDEALEKKANLIISHHPLIFSGLKKITGTGMVDRCVAKAIKHDIVIYAAHTNIDNVQEGVNGMIAKKLGLQNTQILVPAENHLIKLVTFAPLNNASKIRQALFEAGAGNIGNYDSCSFSTSGKGTFRGNDLSNPYVGKKGEMHTEEEERIEVIAPRYNKSRIIKALLSAHPYEEPAFDIFPLENAFASVGAGIIGWTNEKLSEEQWLKKIKDTFSLKILRHSELTGNTVSKIAVCGGAGSKFLKNTIAQGAQLFISSEFSYHSFFDADNKIVIVDIGHFESEQFTIELFYELILKKIPNFAVHLTKVNTNPVNYF